LTAEGNCVLTKIKKSILSIIHEHVEKLSITDFADLRSSTTTDELTFAAASNLHGDGHRAAADIIFEATQNSPTRPKKMRRVLDEAASHSMKMIEEYSAEEALALKIDAD